MPFTKIDDFADSFETMIDEEKCQATFIYDLESYVTLIKANSTKSQAFVDLKERFEDDLSTISGEIHVDKLLQIIFGKNETLHDLVALSPIAVALKAGFSEILKNSLDAKIQSLISEDIDSFLLKISFAFKVVDDTSLELEIKDNGPGFPDAFLKKYSSENLPKMTFTEKHISKKGKAYYFGGHGIGTNLICCNLLRGEHLTEFGPTVFCSLPPGYNLKTQIKFYNQDGAVIFMKAPLEACKMLKTSDSPSAKFVKPIPLAHTLNHNPEHTFSPVKPAQGQLLAGSLLARRASRGSSELSLGKLSHKSEGSLFARRASRGSSELSLGNQSHKSKDSSSAIASALGDSSPARFLSTPKSETTSTGSYRSCTDDHTLSLFKKSRSASLKSEQSVQSDSHGVFDENENEVKGNRFDK